MKIISNTEIKLENFKLRKYEDIEVSSVSQEEEKINTSELGFGYLNQNGVRGVIKNDDVKALVNTEPSIVGRHLENVSSENIVIDIGFFTPRRVAIRTMWFGGNSLWMEIQNLLAGDARGYSLLRFENIDDEWVLSGIVGGWRDYFL